MQIDLVGYFCTMSLSLPSCDHIHLFCLIWHIYNNTITTRIATDDDDSNCVTFRKLIKPRSLYIHRKKSFKTYNEFI